MCTLADACIRIEIHHIVVKGIPEEFDEVA